MVADPAASMLTTEPSKSRLLDTIPKGHRGNFLAWSSAVSLRVAAEGINASSQSEFDALDPKKQARYLEIILRTLSDGLRASCKADLLEELPPLSLFSTHVLSITSNLLTYLCALLTWRYVIQIHPSHVLSDLVISTSRNAVEQMDDRAVLCL